MSTLAPRRKPIFNRRGDSQRLVRRLGLAVVFLFVASASFAAGVQVGAGAPAGTALQSIISASLN